MSAFGNLFKKRNPQLDEALSFSPIVADMHSHLLPGIDDGSVDMENSIELISALHSMGYKKLITTPHIFWDMYKNTTEIIREKEALVLNGALLGLELLDDCLRHKFLRLQIHRKMKIANTL